jgi:hypothetical protein
MTKKLLYTFNHFESEEIVSVLDSPVIDILAFSLQSGKIVFLNIRTDQILFTLKQ